MWSSARAARRVSCRRCVAWAWPRSRSVPMRQILRRRELSADPWRYPGEPAPAGDAGAGGAGAWPVLTLAEWLSAAAGSELAHAGVQVGPTEDVLQLAPSIARLSLVVVR